MQGYSVEVISVNSRNFSSGNHHQMVAQSTRKGNITAPTWLKSFKVWISNFRLLVSHAGDKGASTDSVSVEMVVHKHTN